MRNKPVEFPAAFADQLIQKPEFEMSIPDGWIEMPRDVLDEYFNTLKRVMPSVDIERFDYGFQPAGQEWFEYPYMLIENRHTGRISERELANIARADMSAVVRKEQRDTKSIASNLRIGQPEYDEISGLIWLRTDATVVNSGPVSGVISCALTEQGLVRASAYARSPDFPNHESSFRQCLSTLKADPSIAYQRRASQSPQTVTGAAFTLVGLVVGILVVIGLIVYLVRTWMTD